MLGQMGTDQSLAGPVQGGNMVVKPNQVPVGGAAMLSKALRRQADKGVGGMYVLPEQQDQTPDFMKIAQSNVMRDIEGQRNQYPNNYSEAEGGIIPMLPRNLKTAPGADETTLAYITPEEQAILGLLNPGTPHRGPEDIPTYDSVDYDESGNVYVTTGEQASAIESGASPSDVGMSQAHQDAYEGSALEPGQAWVFDDEGQHTGEVFQGNIGTPTGTTTTEEEEETVSVTEHQNNADKIQKQLDELNKKEQEGTLTKADRKLIESLNKEKDATTKILKQIFKQQQETRYADIDKEKMSEADIKKLLEQAERYGVDSFNTEQMAQYKALKMSKDKHPGIQMLDAIGLSRDMPGIHASIESLGDDNTLALVGFNQGHLGKDGKLTKKGKAFYNKYDDKMGFVGMESVEDYEKKLGSLYSFDDKGKVKMESDVLGGTQAQRAIDPEKYYLGSDKAKYYGSGATSGRMKELAGVALTGDKNFDRRIIEAREIASRQRDRQDGGGGQRPGSMGGGTAPVVEDEVTEAVVEEGATTMPYTGPRTGGAEVNVPLSRRFALDPTQDVAQYKTAPRSTEDIYKYFTEGTTGEGRMLEPYGEFQKRRRKALGKKPLDFWSY